MTQAKLKLCRKEGNMSKREVYETRTEALLQPIATAQGVEIYDVEYVKVVSSDAEKDYENLIK